MEGAPAVQDAGAGLRSEAEVWMATIIAIVQADGEGGYTASTPDFPQCLASSHTIDGVIKKLRESLLLRIEQLLETGETIPVPTPMGAIRRQDSSVMAAIEISDDIGIRQVEIAIPALSLARVESFANRRGLPLGTLLVQAVDRWAMQEAGWRERRGAVPDGPTLFDFSTPAELRVEAVAAEFARLRRGATVMTRLRLRAWRAASRRNWLGCLKRPNQTPAAILRRARRRHAG